jgi:1-acyl-sn-glycerol-3-phosphate acyltransferase
MKIKQRLALKILHWKGWKFTGAPENIQRWCDTQKCILIVAPHTSLSDYFVGYISLAALGKKASFLINKKFFFFPLNFILKAHGGIPVKTGKDTDFLQQIIESFEKTDQMFLTITPEGTRKKVTRWKKGFHQLTQATNAPLLLGALDYKKKHIILGAAFAITDDFNADMKEIGKFYEDVSGKHPEKFSVHVGEAHFKLPLI